MPEIVTVIFGVIVLVMIARLHHAINRLTDRVDAISRRVDTLTQDLDIGDRA